MSEHQPPPGVPGRAESGRPEPGGAAEGHGQEAADQEASEADLIRKVMRTQERHREGGIDADLEEDAPG